MNERCKLPYEGVSDQNVNQTQENSAQFHTFWSNKLWTLKRKQKLRGFPEDRNLNTKKVLIHEFHKKLTRKRQSRSANRDSQIDNSNPVRLFDLKAIVCIIKVNDKTFRNAQCLLFPLPAKYRETFFLKKLRIGEQTFLAKFMGDVLHGNKFSSQLNTKSENFSCSWWKTHFKRNPNQSIELSFPLGDPDIVCRYIISKS